MIEKQFHASRVHGERPCSDGDDLTGCGMDDYDHLGSAIERSLRAIRAEQNDVQRQMSVQDDDPLEEADESLKRLEGALDDLDERLRGVPEAGEANDAERVARVEAIIADTPSFLPPSLILRIQNDLGDAIARERRRPEFEERWGLPTL